MERTPKKLLRTFKNVATIKQAVEQNSVALSKLSKTYGDDKCEKYIKIWLIDLNISLTVNNPLNETQIDFIAFQVMNHYRDLTLSDINLIFTRAKSGYYGKVYENISPDKVLIWFADYFSERLEVCAEISRNKHHQGKEPEPKHRSSDESVKSVLKRLK